MKTTILIASSILVLSFASCSSDNGKQGFLSDTRVEFSSGISAIPTKSTKAIDNKWEGNEKIGVYMTNNGLNTIAEGATNILYTTSTAGFKADFTSTTPIYYPVNAMNKVDFYAYSPYSTSVNNMTYTVDVSNQANQSAIDLMSAKANNGANGYDKNHNSQVELNFKHELVKLILQIEKGDGVTSLDGLAVKINGMSTKHNFSIYERVLANNPSTDPLVITPFEKSGVFEAILLPTDLGDTHKIEFTTADLNTYTWVMKNDINPAKLVAGTKYTYKITLKKTGVSIIGTIENWNENSGAGIAD